MMMISMARNSQFLLKTRFLKGTSRGGSGSPVWKIMLEMPVEELFKGMESLILDATYAGTRRRQQQIINKKRMSR